MASHASAPTVFAASRDEWRAWLQDNHDKSGGAWLIYFKKGSGKTSISYDEAVEEALAFGWIDSTVNSIDSERYKQYFSPRRKGSIWSKTNKDRVNKLIAEGRMTPAGLAKIEAAKKDGSWTILDEVDSLTVPPDLEEALQSNLAAAEAFSAFNDSIKKQIICWIISAKRPVTRADRIRRVVESAAYGKTPFS